mgnify:CR=1 FL=1
MASPGNPLGDKHLILPLGRRTLSAKLGQYPVHGQTGRRGTESRRRSVARPGIGVEFSGPFGADRIQHHVSAQLQQIALPIHNDGFKAALQHVAHPLMATIECLRVDYH